MATKEMVGQGVAISGHSSVLGSGIKSIKTHQLHTKFQETNRKSKVAKLVGGLEGGRQVGRREGR